MYTYIQYDITTFCGLVVEILLLISIMILSLAQLMSHGEFLNRIQKSLYYSGRKSKMSIPLSDYIAETFSDTHEGYSLNRLNFSTIGNLRSTPCSLILALVYLERLKDADPSYTKHVTPTELFLVSMVIDTIYFLFFFLYHTTI